MTEDHTYDSISPDPSVRFGATPGEWLHRWDSGFFVWSVEMGGLGPAYEQCIQITSAEVLRDLLARSPDPKEWDDEKKWEAERDLLYENSLKNEEITKLGITGAQWGSAVNLATGLYIRTPVVALSDPRIADRLIQVKRTFP